MLKRVSIDFLDAEKNMCPFTGKNCFGVDCFAWTWIDEKDEQNPLGTCLLIPPMEGFDE